MGTNTNLTVVNLRKKYKSHSCKCTVALELLFKIGVKDTKIQFNKKLLLFITET